MILVSCKKHIEKKYPENPDWLSAKISQMEAPPEYAGAKIYAYEWNNEYYYLISLPLSSCAMCEFFSYEGVKYEWSSHKSDDFQKNAKMVKIVWQRELSLISILIL
jgi:hypothetical protein